MKTFLVRSVLVALLFCGGVGFSDSVFAQGIVLSLSDDSPKMGEELVLTADAGPRVTERKYTFLYRFDDESQWTQIVHRTPSSQAVWTPPKSGSVELRVDSVAPDRPEVRRMIRVFVKTGREGSRMTGRSSLVPGEFPGYQGPVGLHVDKPAGLPGAARRVSILLSDARNSRRVTYLVRHQTDQQWQVVKQNADALTFAWTPTKIGRYTLRVDTDRPSDNRVQMVFTCLDPNGVAGSRMRGN